MSHEAEILLTIALITVSYLVAFFIYEKMI